MLICILLLFRLVEEVKQKCGVSLTNEEVYMNTDYGSLLQWCILKSRGLTEEEFSCEYVSESSSSSTHIFSLLV